MLCWQHHVPEGTWTDDEGIDHHAISSDILPDDFFQPKGPPPLRQKWKDLTSYATPPIPGDGTWIMNQFLNDCLGDEGGEVFIGNVDLPPFQSLRSSHLRTRLLQFITRPLYHNYPWRHEWEDMVANPAGNITTHIRSNVMFCRPIVSTRNKTFYAGMVESFHT